jgi:hypothetical protein
VNGAVYLVISDEQFANQQSYESSEVNMTRLPIYFRYCIVSLCCSLNKLFAVIPIVVPFFFESSLWFFFTYIMNCVIDALMRIFVMIINNISLIQFHAPFPALRTFFFCFGEFVYSKHRKPEYNSKRNLIQ